MSAANTTTISLIVVLAAAVLLTAQTPAALSETAVQGLEIAFAGFDGQNRPTYDVAVDLAAHAPSLNGDSLIVRIRDDCTPPPFNPTVPEASWTYSGRSSKPLRVTVRLTL